MRPGSWLCQADLWSRDLVLVGPLLPGQNRKWGPCLQKRAAESRPGGAGRTRLALPMWRPPSAGWKLGRLGPENILTWMRPTSPTAWAIWLRGQVVGGGLRGSLHPCPSWPAASRSGATWAQPPTPWSSGRTALLGLAPHIPARPTLTYCSHGMPGAPEKQLCSRLCGWSCGVSMPDTPINSVLCEAELVRKVLMRRVSS